MKEKKKVKEYCRRPMREHEMNYAEIAKKQKQIEDNLRYQLQKDRCRSVRETTV